MNFIRIGNTKKTHGVQGELKVVIDEKYEVLFQENVRVFLEVRGSKQPFIIEEIRGGGDMIVRFDHVPTREDALLLQSRGIFLPVDEVPELPEQNEDGRTYGRIVGYLIVDQKAGDIGIVEEVLEMPQQEMAQLRYRGREVLIPLNSQFVMAVDDESKRVLVDLPEGLLTL